MIPTFSPDTLLIIGAYLAALAAVVTPIVYVVRLEFALRYVKKEVTECKDSITSVEKKVEDLMLSCARWFATPLASPRRKGRALRPLAGRGRR